MYKEEIEQLKGLLGKAKKISIFPHKNPDGDAIGSALAIYMYLKKKNYEVKVISPNDFPHFLKWLPYAEEVYLYEHKKEDSIDDYIRTSDVIFILDFNHLGRVDVAGLEAIIAQSAATKVMIDHHEQPMTFDINFSDPKSPATAQIIYKILSDLDDDTIDAQIATAIYTGIMTDTGSFRFASTSPETHRVVANLIEKGVAHDKIHQNVHEENHLSRYKILGKALDNLKVLEAYRAAYTYISTVELERARHQRGDTEEIVNYGLGLKNMVLSIIFIEERAKGFIKVSLRSKGQFDVNELAREHFNGGGHLNAAGGRLEMPLNQVEQYLLGILPLYQEKLLVS